MASQDYKRVTVKGHPIADAGGKSYAHRVALYDAIGPGPHVCHWCKLGGLEWGQGNGPNAVYVDHLNTDRRDDAASNLAATHKWCNDNRHTVEQLAIPWSAVAAIPPADRPAFYNPGTHKATAAALQFAVSHGATPCPEPPAEVVERTPWDALLSVPAALVDRYPFLAEVKP